MGKNKSKYILFIVFILFSFFWVRAEEKSAGDNLFISKGTILTITKGKIEGGSILIKNGKIFAVGKDLKPPEGIKIIDATGKYVMPGIIDSHSHMAIDRGINESTSQVTPQVNIQDVIKHDDIAIYRALAGGTTCVQPLHGSANVIGGHNAVIKLKWGKPPEELLVKDSMQGIKFALGENPKKSNFPMPRGPEFPNTRMGIEFVIRDSFNHALEYMKKWDEYQKKKSSLKKGEIPPLPPKRDLKLEALADILKRNLGIVCHGYRADELLMMLKTADEYGAKVVSFEHCLEGYKVADEIAKHGTVASIFADNWAYKIEAFDAIPFNAAILTERGVAVTVNSDSDERVRRLYQDAAKTMKYGGLSEEEALKTITINPAKMLGIDHRCGSIEVGKDGDLAIFNGHPLSVYSKVLMTIIEGEVYFDIEKAITAEKALAMAKEKEKK
ncbi:MAG: amidohydrolase family protein [Acidobacteriota bacterium]